MIRDRRLSRVLHALVHMAEHDGPTTSDALASAMSTNAVVVRRIMAGLRDAGYVRSEKGHGGGWSLACDLAQVTLRDVYEALGSPALFTMGHDEAGANATGCLVAAAVDASIAGALDRAEAELLARFGEITLASLGDEVRRRATSRGRAHRGPPNHR